MIVRREVYKGVSRLLSKKRVMRGRVAMEGYVFPSTEGRVVISKTVEGLNLKAEGDGG